MTKTEYLEKICADLGIDVSALPDKLVSTYLGAIKERLGMMNEGGTLSEHLEAFSEPYDAGVSDGMKASNEDVYNAGYEAGAAQGGVASVPTATDGRTSLAYWYGCFNFHWERYSEDGFSYDPIAEPLDSVEYPSGTQNVTDFSRFLTVFYNDYVMGGMYEEPIRTKRFTGELDMSGASSARGLFNGCEVLEDCGRLVNTGRIVDFYNMFSGCRLLASPIEIDTSGGEDFTFMFSRCSALTTIRNINLSNAKTTSNMFNACNALEHLSFFGVIPISIFFTHCNNLSHESLMNILNTLKDHSKSGGSFTLNLGATNLAKLTEEELDIAVLKGWQVK